MFITSLRLSAFRNYQTLHLPDLPAGLIGLVGENGAGKTNVLEAVSLLSPGRGLRNADLRSLQARATSPEQTPWTLHARIEGRYGPQDLGVGIDPQTGRRRVHLNGEALKSQTDRADLVRCIWLTPAHDRLFLDGASARRKLLDRWVFSTDPAHAGRIARLDRLLAERNRLLSTPGADGLWLDAIEQDLSETALAVAIARTDYLDRLKTQLAAQEDQDFPRALVALHGFLEDRIGKEPALQIETDYRHMLRANRPRDREAEATTIGPHRSDLFVTYADKNMPAPDCSTGEQKALLFSLFLSHARLLHEDGGEPPVLLLDEITAHLDPDRRRALLEQLLALAGQVFMTATTPDQFASLPASHLITLHAGQIVPNA